VAAASRNAREAGVGDVVSVAARDVRELVLPGERAVIVSNPPYGERLGDPAVLATLYRELGDTLKRRAAGATAWLLVGNLELAKAIGLRASRRIVLFNGPIECRLLRFDLYEGSREAGG
jgi:putative N6-adenine-specific DNA methylase